MSCTRFIHVAAAAAAISLLLAAQPRQARAQCGSVGVQQTLNDVDGYIWDIYENGSIGNGTGDSYDYGMVLFVDGTMFPVSQRTLSGRHPPGVRA